MTSSDGLGNLPDGRIRYSKLETPASTFGYTRGANPVVEFNPKTGMVRSWHECRNHFDQIIRVHPKTINGQNVIAPHYPPTAMDLIK